MKQTWSICKAELSQLFFSPIAWLILVIFSFQTYQAFTGSLAGLASDMDLYGAADNVTYGLFANYRGIYTVIKDNLYMFIPLLTMGLMSKELSSGSIKLLYSSPVTSTQIVLGKYLSMVVFSVVMIGVTLPAILFTSLRVENADMGLMFSGLAGQFFLFWAYAAIGLFMSCLTSYQIVAALLTLGALAFLNQIAGMGQGIDFVRDITYWAAISGRTSQLMEGLVSSEDVIYFVIVIALFLCYSIFLLQYRKNPRRGVCAAKYIGATVLVLAVGYITSRPALIFYHDASQIDANTLTETSIKTVQAVKGRLEITTYVNLADYDSWSGAPATINDDIARYKKYIRFKPDIHLHSVYYYDEAYHNPDYGHGEFSTKEMAMKFAEGFDIPWRKVLSPDEIHKKIDLSGEKNHVVKQLVTSDGKKAWLRIFDDMTRYPDEAEITAAMYRLENDAPVVAFLTGQNERDIYRNEDGDYGGFSSSLDSRSSLVNVGFDVKTVSADSSISADILFIADSKKAFTSEEKDNVFKYLDEGGDMVLAFEPQRIDNVLDILSYLGVMTLPGTVVYPKSATAPTLIPAVVTDYASSVSEYLRPGMRVALPSATAIDYEIASEWDAVPILATPGTDCWNETEITDFSAVTDSSDLVCNRGAREFRKAHCLALALRRVVNGKEQRVVVIGDADCLSNLEMTTERKAFKSYNQAFCSGIFNWLSGNKLPVDIVRKAPIDNSIDITTSSAYTWTILFKWALQALLALIGIVIILSRQRR